MSEIANSIEKLVSMPNKIVELLKNVVEVLGLLKEIKIVLEQIRKRDFDDLILLEEDVMKKLNIGDKTLRNRRKYGEISCCDPEGKQVYYLGEHIMDYLRNSEVKRIK